ncbi:hypothetical protein HD806DRAFT_550664 [Xylariaceae sp. AK1471]|nr:hypothetical protein HD806DRAFT_550664 [Xylariaceae sp. AK1471]
MDSTNRGAIDTSSSQANNSITNTAQKRKASETGGVDSHMAKRTQPTRRVKKMATFDSVADTTLTPGPAGTTPSVAPELQVQPLPFPVGLPPVSSNIRGALCDTLPYWKVHQGGIHSNNKAATGMLLNGHTTPRDVIQSQVVVTTVGGGFVLIEGSLIRTQDHHESCRNYVVLKGAMDQAAPVAIIAGKQAVKGGKASKKVYFVNSLFPVPLDRRYNVLAWFYVTDIWSEYQPTQKDGTRYKHYMVRLEKIDLASPSWWALPDNAVNETHAVGEFHCREIVCQSCNTLSQEIFKEGWCCLEKTCAEFFRFPNPTVEFDSLQYHENFLNKRKEWAGRRPLPPLVPALPTIRENEFGSEEKFKGGIVCPTCKIACRRVHWSGWMCENGCGFTWLMAPKDVPIQHIQVETQRHIGNRDKYFQVDHRIVRVPHNVQGFEATTFYLPNVPSNLDQAEFVGSVTVFRPMEATLQRQGGLNDLFGEIQKETREGAIKLRRHPARCKGSHQEELTSHFSMNMGADYKFGVAVETSSGFDSAPDPVMKALSRLTWGGSTAVELTAHDIRENGRSVDHESMPSDFIDFNEQLMLGYFEKSQISFHDDGERELGPTVATLSLGSPSTMRFRAKSKSGIHNTVGAGRIMLSLYLEHGDMVIMHGTKIHQYYEHTVLAGGIRRYALTCRYIRPEMIEDPERREKAVVSGQVPVYWQKKAYKGETTDALYEEAKNQHDRSLHSGNEMVDLADIHSLVKVSEDTNVNIADHADGAANQEVFHMDDTADGCSVVSGKDSIVSDSSTLLGAQHKIPYGSHDRLMSSTQEIINTIQANEDIVEDLEPAARVNLRILGALLADKLGK